MDDCRAKETAAKRRSTAPALTISFCVLVCVCVDDFRNMSLATPSSAAERGALAHAARSANGAAHAARAELAALQLRADVAQLTRYLADSALWSAASPRASPRQLSPRDAEPAEATAEATASVTAEAKVEAKVEAKADAPTLRRRAQPAAAERRKSIKDLDSHKQTLLHKNWCVVPAAGRVWRV